MKVFKRWTRDKDCIIFNSNNCCDNNQYGERNYFYIYSDEFENRNRLNNEDWCYDTNKSYANFVFLLENLLKRSTK